LNGGSINLFELFSVSRQVIISEGEITINKQPAAIFPINAMGAYILNLKQDRKKERRLYESVKKGMVEFSVSLGEEYQLTSKIFLDRWIKYCGFAGWGIVSYKVIEEENCGILYIKDLPLHNYLRDNGVKEPSDPLFEGFIAGSASGTFRADIDVIETECVCSGSDKCVYYWGPKAYLKERFPDMAKKLFGDIG